MPKLIAKTSLFLFLILGLVFNVRAASPQSDYNYQLTQYRKLYTEFKTLKEDNQKTPTLDNQQKALQAAKQVIISRDTTKIAYIELILSQIRSQKVDQDYILQTEKELINAQSFFKNQIKLAKNIKSVGDLTNFTSKYKEDQIPHQNQMIKALSVKKLAALIRLQINLKNAYDNLLPKIKDKTQAPVSAGLSQLDQLAKNINQKISEDIDLVRKTEVTIYNKSNFYRKQTERLSQIKSMQLELVNILIDLEKNYAR